MRWDLAQRYAKADLSRCFDQMALTERAPPWPTGSPFGVHGSPGGRSPFTVRRGAFGVRHSEGQMAQDF